MENPERYAAERRRTYLRNREAYLERARRSRQEKPRAHGAHRAVEYAVATGKLKRPSECSVCGTSDRAIQAHHEDYERPLDVVWMCSVCHGRHHWLKDAA